MGLFSGLFGGGGGSTTTNSRTTVNVTPRTEINIPLDKLAEAITTSAQLEGELSAKVQTALKRAELQQQEQIKKAELVQNEKTRKSLFFLGAIGLTVYFIKNNKKGK